MIAALAFLGTITVFSSEESVCMRYKSPSRVEKVRKEKKKRHTNTRMGHLSPWVDAENSCCLEVSLIEKFQQQLDTEAGNRKPWPKV